MGLYPLTQVPSSRLKGGLALAWRSEMDIDCLQSNVHHISWLVYSNPPHQPWILSSVHGPSYWLNKSSFWFELSNLGEKFAGPWLVLGDLNAISSQSDKLDGKPYSFSSQVPFISFIHSNGLIDLGYSGNPFTWTNKRQGKANIRELLDQCLSNREWLSLFSNATMSHLPASSSDSTCKGKLPALTEAI